MKLFTLLAALLSTCFVFGKTPEKELEDYLKELGQEFTQMAEKKYNLHCAHFGAIAYDEKIILAVEFTSNTPTPLEAARKLDIDVVQDLLAVASKNRKTPHFFTREPISMYDLSVSYSFEKPTGGYLETGLSFVHHNTGTILYKAEDPVTKKYTCVCKESFNDALNNLNKK